jgi:CRISPR system Cascade subunit CasA
MMPLNLLDPWIPAIRADRSKVIIAPWQIAETDNPIIALNAPRPDFNGSLIQFLIGLLQTAYAPKERTQWRQRFSKPPVPEELQEAFERYRHAFNLDGDGPRFMQDLDILASQKPLPITVLLIDTAGSETHFIKNLPEQGISPAMAAMALYTLQTNAPAGGAGNRTSLRGGGPLTTLVMATPEEGETQLPLWQTLWLNVLEVVGFDSDNQRDEDIFPWLGSTRTSEPSSKTHMTTPDSVNPLQMFWGMPRRIRLDFEAVGQGECGLSGVSSEMLVRQYRAKNYGTNYAGDWIHTLSPHNHDGVTEAIPVHPRGNIHYRHWLGLVQKSNDKKIQRGPAKTIVRFTEQNISDLKHLRFRLWAFGYDLDKMKPRCWYEGTMPLFHLDTPELRQRFESTTENLVRAAGEFLGNLRSCLKEAWFDSEDPRRTKADMGFLDAAFWPDTENEFYGLLDHLSTDAGNDELRKQIFLEWHRTLDQYTKDAFRRHADTKQIAEQNPKRIARAFRQLKNFNFKKDIKILLEMPLKPEKSTQ